MLIYKQRYKPRTSRAFTKSDLTVYDSAGNTALNALTVYGKSEVVDGAIKSAGEGYAVVDLGTKNWNYTAFDSIYVFTCTINDMHNTALSAYNKILCTRYHQTPTATSSNNTTVALMQDREIQIKYESNQIYVKDSNYTDADTFKNSLNGVLLCYELADPTQGNTIAVKTDNGTGINGTMAAFETGTPLRGITGGARDVMEWDGSSGEVTKKCGVDNLGIRTWNVSGSADHSFYIGIDNRDVQSNTVITNLADYTQVYSVDELATTDKSFLCRIGTTALIFRDTAYTDPIDFGTSMNGKMLIYELATPITTPLSSTENASIAGLRTFTPQTHAQNNTGAEMTVDYTIRVPTI